MPRITQFCVALLVAWSGCELYANATEIHSQRLRMESPPMGEARTEKLLPDEVPGVDVEHVALTGPRERLESLSKEADLVFLFIKGRGKLHAGETSRQIDPETIALPITYPEVRIEAPQGETLHYLRVKKAFSEEDLAEADSLSLRNELDIYFKKFSECRAYTEKIKSPKTVSRTLLPEGHAARLAMGTVETTGPDGVGAHEHPMLDQLFLGLADNDSMVFADDTKTRFSAFTLLHIPLGSRHWVEVESDRRMYYVWMDFFLNKEGLDWLKTHQHVEPDEQSVAPSSLAQERVAYTLRSLPGYQVDASVTALPDLSSFTKDAVRLKMPAERNGKATIGLASELKLLEESFRRERGRDLQRRQGTEKPRVIYIDGGPVTLEQIVEQVNDATVIDNRDGIVTLRLPLVIRPGGALLVDGESTPRLQLSTDRGAFIANAGRLFVLDTVVTSWSEESMQSTTFVAKHEFRPFISSYIRSETYVAGCTIEHLGFAAPTAYGLSLSSHPERERGEAQEDWPMGVLVGNEFRGLYYGFYSYEARDVAIVDNRYVDNVVYGIDPHDRSTRLVIARNTCSGTVERHGIIGSRGISKSFILENVTHGNTGSGIMLDRECADNVVCNNRVYQNGQGVAIYESPENLVCENMIAFNEKSGVRVRNSPGTRVLENTIIGNKDYALEVDAKQLTDHAKRVARGDTYSTKVSVSFHGNTVRSNRGLIKADHFDWIRVSNIRRDIDLSAVAAGLEVDDQKTLTTNDSAFGKSLKPLSRELQRVLNEESTVLEVTKVGTQQR